MRRHTGAREETPQVPELEKKHLRKSLAKQPKPKHFFPAGVEQVGANNAHQVSNMGTNTGSCCLS